jgi:hypothetical protein
VVTVADSSVCLGKRILAFDEPPGHEQEHLPGFIDRK